MSFERLATLYVFCNDWHSGQWSRLYILACKLQSHYKLELRGDWQEWRETPLYAELEASLLAGKIK